MSELCTARTLKQTAPCMSSAASDEANAEHQEKEIRMHDFVTGR